MVAQVIRSGSRPNSNTIEDFKPHEAIERQQSEIDRLRAALKEILVGAEMEQCDNYSQAISNRKIIAKIARAAITGAKGAK